MEQDEVAMVKAIESGDTDLGTFLFFMWSNSSVYCSTTSSKETPVGSILQGHQ